MSTLYSRHPPTSYEGRMPGVSSRHSPGYTPSVGERRPPVPRATSLNRATPTRRTSTSSTRDFDYHSYQSRPSPIGNQTLGRSLPKGPGPLDTSGRKLANYTIGSGARTSPTKTYVHNGPLKATHDYSISYNNSYGSGVGASSTLGRHGVSSTYTSSSSGSRPGSLRGRRSSSLANIKDGVDNLKITDLEYESQSSSRNKDEVITRQPRRTSGVEESYHPSKFASTPRGSRLESDSSDDRAETLSRGSRTSVINVENKNSHDDIEERVNGSRSYNRSSRTGRDTPVDRKNFQQSSKSVGPISRFSSGGKSGLRNLGNTCFMNSVLQCLSNTRCLLEYCLEDEFHSDKNVSTSSMKGNLITAYANLMKSMWMDTDSYVSPTAFKTQIQRFAPRFMGYAQQDSQEFLRYLLEGLHEDVNRVTSKPKPVSIDDDKFPNDQEKAKEYWRVYLTYDNSYIVDLFVGQLKSTLRFEECGHTSVTFDPFWDLSLPIPKGRSSEVSINKCINLFMKEEELDHDERPTCSKCKKRKACTKSFSIQRFPKVLVLHLKRFSQSRYSQKVSTTVDFPQDLDMTDYAADKAGRVVYSLYAVSNHSGGTHSGHYTATCKHPYSKEWSLFNDTRVSPSSADRAVSSEAYLLFYELKSGSSRL